MVNIKIVTINILRDILDVKIKPMSKEQIIISVDRLTRFKNTEVKYLRVFKDILISNLIYPKFKRSELDLMDYCLLRDYAVNIINFSLSSLGFEDNNEFIINHRLLDYEKKLFKLDSNTICLLENKINYNAVVSLLDNETNLVFNLNWLKELSVNQDIYDARFKLSLKFPIEKIIITEGITEEILLPVFAKVCGYDFDKNGVYILSAGGKNQVVKLFYQLVNVINLPLFVLLDNDAVSNLNEIKPKLRDIDTVHLLKSGEFEDLLPLPLIQRALNYDFKNFTKIELEFLKQDLPMVKILEELFKEKGLHEFKKSEFAALVAQQIKDDSDVSSEISEIISELKKTKRDLPSLA